LDFAPRFHPLYIGGLPTDSNHHSYNITTPTKNGKMNTEVAIVTRKLIKRSQELKERYQSELGKLSGPEKYALAVEVARLTQEQ